MKVKVDAESFELFSGNVADEAIVGVVVVDGFELASHFGEGVDDDAWDDGGDNQVDEEHIEEVEDVGGEGDDAIVFPSNWRASEAVVDVCAEAVEEVGAVHIAFEIISSSIRPVEL